MGYNFKTLFAVCVIAGLCIHGTDAAFTEFAQTVVAPATVLPALAGGTITDATTITLAENFGNGTITTFRALDVNGTEITGEWTSGTPTAVVIGLNTGAVTVAALDYETATYIIVTITFDDSSTPSVRGTVTLTLTVTDVIENPPAFASSNYRDRVADGATAGRTVTTVTAVDREGDAFKYAITVGNTDDVFTIGATNGKITTAKAIPSTPISYRLTVTATDTGTPPMTSTATVDITLGTACTIDSNCNVAPQLNEDCQTFEGANVCKCKTDFTDTGSTTGQRCQADCPALVPTHGSLSDGSNEVGSTRTLTCDEGYSINGEPTVICQTDTSTWDKTLGTCSGAVPMLGGMLLLSMCSIASLMFHL